METQKRRIVKFCRDCSDRNKCGECDKRFGKKNTFRTTTVQDMATNDITTFITEVSRMIVDLGCPNSVIGVKDVDAFIKSLTEYQKTKLEIRQVEESFKFGPSGPYRCSEKLVFPIRNGSDVLGGEVSVVDANIPMLLGNNILKPLAAEIKLIETGNGNLKLRDAMIPLQETVGGHYTVKVSSLAKLCPTQKSDVYSCARKVGQKFPCYICEKEFQSRKDLTHHMVTVHGDETCNGCTVCDKNFNIQSKFANHERTDHDDNVLLKTALKDNVKTHDKQVQKLSVDKVLTDFNTLMNGARTERDRLIVQTMKNTFLINSKCSGMRPCNNCDLECSKNSNLKTHESDTHEESIFLMHHEEIIDETEIELSDVIWDIFFSEDEAKELTEAEQKEVLKLHRYFAHRSGAKLWNNLFQPSGKLKGKKRLVLEFLEKCETCRKYRRTPSRPRVGLPKAKDFNDVVSLDLKIFKKDGKKKKEIGILYIHDEFSKMIKGKVINDKKRDTIIEGIESKWIIGDGSGPGHPTRGFFSDNGGEFLNSDLIDFAGAMDISIRMTAAESPWMNGSCERNHATVDRILEKILEDDPKINLQKAVDLACFVKNTEINKTGFSPLQLFCGRSPTFPGLSDCTPSSIELEGNNQYLDVLRRLNDARVEARRIDCDQRMKIALKSKINTSCERSYNIGDSVFFKLDTDHKWKSGLVLGKDGKVLFVKYGNFMRRIPIDRVVPAERYQETSDDDAGETDIVHKDRLDDDKFDNLEIIAQKESEIEELKKANAEQQKILEKIANEKNKPKDPKNVQKLPKNYQMIRFKMDGKEDFLDGKVVKRHKPNSAHKNIVVVQFGDGSIEEYDFAKDIIEWDYAVEVQEEICHEAFPTVLTRAQVKGRPEADEVMMQELKKFKDFSAFEVVNDDGQYAIKTRWVFTEHDEKDKGYKLKSRLCMRGDKEEAIDQLRADSPTAHKDSLKLSLTIAANEDFKIVSADIKSAFLQGRSLDRKVFVIPPPEAGQNGKLWLLKKAAYGLMDASRLFYLELKAKLEMIGLKQVSGDPAVFTTRMES